jgi:hypothetical protein
MKKTMTGMLAFSKMMSTELPEKTGTYTPISHSEIIAKVRSEIIDAGFTITREEYSCSSEGKVAVGSFGLVYKADKDIELCANFMNSYNKRYAFRFSLGGIIKVNNAVFMLNDAGHGSFKRMHTGLADIMSSHKIKEFIDNAGEYWDSLVNAKNLMQSIKSYDSDLYSTAGKLFFDKKILNTFQLSQIREEFERARKDAEAEERNLTLWDVYSSVTFGVREGNPTTWMNDLEAIHEVFAPFIEDEEHTKMLAAKKMSAVTAGAGVHAELEAFMESSGMVSSEVFENTDPIENLPKVEDNPNVLRVSYQPSDEEIFALKEAGIEVIVESNDFDEKEFDDQWEESAEEVAFVDTPEFEEDFEESFDLEPKPAKIDHNDPWDRRF